ncbi:hypothetical protein GPECTOR_40g525 [Gonium pectorale]|uniref:Uncharacterized protein n=1 Tax=Gonium pectorale TaxID=33097 RepID=A0A150GAC1_GONPE|nr:hypothetical protein GPECTOR_40g525 [Gonium pectorale]|eukprot:KXZ46791.1 hypothetical protein GPECTOR_40g525 [Gonium pectorale]
MFRLKGLSPEGDATLVLATPGGLALEPFHFALLAPFSRRPPVTLAELGRRNGLAVDWSGEGQRVHCFSQLVACKLEQRDNTAPNEAAGALADKLGAALPPDPLGFGPPPQPAAGGAAPEGLVLRVVIEARSAAWRSIKNVADILRACDEANAKGFAVGPFKGIQCRLLPRGLDAAPQPAGPLGSNSPGVQALYQAIGAVRSAHLFVAAVGSSGAHAFFMKPDQSGGAGFLELRPCGWGSTHAGEADGGKDAMMAQLQRGGDAIRFFAYNLEDPAQCSPPDYQPALRAALDSKAPMPWQTPQAAHQLQGKPPPRYSPDQLMARDQHLTPKPGALLAMIRHAAGLLADKGAYTAARSASRLHGYGVPQGVWLGPQGLTDAPQKAQAGGQELLPA